MKSQPAVFAIMSVLALAQAAAAQAPVQAPPARPAGSTPATHAAVIDVGYIFKNHGRF